MDYLEEYQKKYFSSPLSNKFKEFKGYVLSPKFEEIANKIYDMECREDDVWVVTFPRAGTTWAQELLWMIMNDLNFEEGLKECIRDRSPDIELSALFDFEGYAQENPDVFKATEYQIIQNSFDNVQQKMKEFPRLIIKTHLPWTLLPKQIQEGTKTPKIVYVRRNPKDVCTSYYYHSQSFFGYSGDFESFCELFLAGKMYYTPYWPHVLSFYERKDPHILFLTYEEMIKDIRSVIRKASDFLGKSLNENQVEKLADHLSFENMKKNKSVNKELKFDFRRQFACAHNDFMRSGKIGSFKECMSPEMMSRFDKWTKENSQGVDF